MKKTKISIMRILAVFLITVILFSLASCMSGLTTENDIAQATENIEVENDTPTYALPKAMSFSAKALKRSSSGSVSVKVSAVVYPIDTKVDRSVDWFVAWADASNTAPVSDYLTVTPEYDGSANATITCYGAFEGDIIITVKTRAADFYDTCVVMFVGKPTSLEIETDATTVFSGVIGEYYELGSNISYQFTYIADNELGQLGDVNYEVNVIPHGSIIIKDQEYITHNDNIVWLDGTETTLRLDHISAISKYYPSLYDFSVSDGVITIKTNCTLEDYYVSSVRDSTKVTYTGKFYAYTDEDWYYEVIVTETNSGLSQSFKFRPIKGIESVDLETNVISI